MLNVVVTGPSLVPARVRTIAGQMTARHRRALHGSRSARHVPPSRRRSVSHGRSVSRWSREVPWKRGAFHRGVPGLRGRGGRGHDDRAGRGLARDWRSALPGWPSPWPCSRSSWPSLGPAVSAARCAACGWSSVRCCSCSACSGCARRSCGPAGTRPSTTRTAIFAGQVSRGAAAPAAAGLRPRRVRVHAVVQGRAARGARGGVHRAHLRQQPARHRAGARWRRPPWPWSAASAWRSGPRWRGCRRTHEVRGRHHADRVRHVLGSRGRGGALAGVDAALLVLVIGRVRAAAGRALRRAVPRRRPPGPAGRGRGRRGGDVAAWIRAFAAFWYDFVIGDDWRGRRW